MGSITTGHPKDFKWSESGRPVRDGVMVHPTDGPNGHKWGQVFMKFLVMPRILELWYEGGFSSLRHQHGVDEIFYIVKGSMFVNGYELTAGSAVVVPKLTQYGPEYTGAEGAHFYRMELWDSEHGSTERTLGPPAPGEMRPGAREWTGAMRDFGAPKPNNTTEPPVPPDQRSPEGAVGAQAGNANDNPWVESVRAGGTEGRVFTRRVLGPVPDIAEVFRTASSGLPEETIPVERAICVLKGELTVDDEKLPKGSVCIIPKDTAHRVRATAAEGAHYLQVTMLDSARPMPKMDEGETRPWAGALTPDGLPEL